MFLAIVIPVPGVQARLGSILNLVTHSSREKRLLQRTYRASREINRFISSAGSQGAPDTVG